MKNQRGDLREAINNMAYEDKTEQQIRNEQQIDTLSWAIGVWHRIYMGKGKYNGLHIDKFKTMYNVLTKELEQKLAGVKKGWKR